MQLRQVGSIIGGLAAGPIGSLIGGVTGGLLGAAVETVIPGASGVITNAAGAFGSEAYRAMGQRMLDGLPPEERALINHDLQRAFRLAVVDALDEISGQEHAAAARRDPRGVPADVRFNFNALPSDLREPMRTCFADLTRAVSDGTLLPITATGSGASVATYIDQTSLAMLSGATSDDRTTLLLLSEGFYGETIGPWLVTHSGFYGDELAPLARHLRRYLLSRTLVHFNERIKDPENTQAWRAFNRTLLEQIRTGIAEVQASQHDVQANQRDLAQKVDSLLRQSTTSATLPAFAGEMGTVIAAIGTSEQHLEETINTAFTRVAAEQTALQVVLRDALNRIEQKIDTIGNTTIRIEDRLGRVQSELERSVPRSHIPWTIANDDVAICPYPGLAVFGADDASYFFGRDADITRLLRHTDHPIVAVTGPSGVGKSSFVLAGVLPQLRTKNPALETIVFRVSTSTDLLRDLAATLATRTGQPTETVLAALQTSDAALREALLALSSTEHVVLVLDQFEELFVGVDKGRVADRARLLELLLEIERHPDPRLLVILTSRENYFEHPDYRARPDLRPIVQQRNVALDGLNDLQLREAILKPLDTFNARPERQGTPPITFEHGVIDLFEQEFRRTERTLPLVQYLLRLLWTERRELSVAAYTQLGGLERALDRHASKIYETFSPEDQRLVRAVLLALVRPGIDNEYTRRRVARDDLIGTGGQRDRTLAVVGRLANQDSRIISEQQVGQVNYLELTHEILLRQWERLRVLIDTYRERLQTRERLLPVAEQWQQSVARGQGKGDTTYLYRGSQLRQAKIYANTTDLPEGVDSGIQSCYLASVRHQRRRIITGSAGTIVAVVAIAFGVNWFVADSRERLAAEQQVSSQRATAQVLAEQTAQAESLQRATAEANAAQEAQRAKREAEVSQSQRLANQARQLLNQGNRALAVTLALEANGIEQPPAQAQQALAEVAYAPGFVADLGPGDAASPDGTIVLDIQDDGRILLHNVVSGTTRELTALKKQYLRPIETRFSDDGAIVVVIVSVGDVASDFSTHSTKLIAWESATGIEVTRQELGTTNCAIFNPRQSNLLVHSSSGFELRDLKTGVVRQHLVLSANDAGSIIGCDSAFNADGTLALVGGGIPLPGGGNEPVNGTALLWDVQSNTILARFDHVAEGLAFGPPNADDTTIRIAYVRDDNALRRVDIRNNQAPVERGSLSGVRGPILWLPQTDTLVTAAVEANTLLVWSGQGAAQRQGGAALPLSYSTTGTSVFALMGDRIGRFDLGNAAQIRGSFTSGDGMNYVGMHYIAVASDSAHVITNLPSAEISPYIHQPLDGSTQDSIGWSFQDPVASADGQVALLAPLAPFGTPDKSLPLYQVIDMKTGTVRGEIRVPGNASAEDVAHGTAAAPALSGDGSLALIAVPSTKDQVDILVWDILKSSSVQRLSTALADVRSLHLSSDGSRAMAIIASQHNVSNAEHVTGPVSMIVWDVQTGTELFQAILDDTGKPIPVVDGLIIEPIGGTFSPDGTLLATTVANGELRLWDVATKAERWRVPTRNETVLFSPDSKKLISASRFGDVQLLDPAAGSLIALLPNGRGPIAFSSDAKRLISGDDGGSVRVWDIDSGNELSRFPVYGDVLALAVAPDNQSFFTGSANGLKQWRFDALDALIAWTKANRTTVALSCEQRTLYQVSPLCPAGSTATPAVATTALVQPTAMNSFTAEPARAATIMPLATPSVVPTSIPASTAITYKVIVTSDGFVSVRADPSRQSTEVQRLTAGTEVICTDTIEGEAITGTSTWAFCPSVGGYIFRLLLEP